MKVIEVVVSSRGETTIQTRGFAGAECQQATQAMENALGVKVADQPTAEFYSTSALQHEVEA